MSHRTHHALPYNPGAEDSERRRRKTSAHVRPACRISPCFASRSRRARSPARALADLDHLIVRAAARAEPQPPGSGCRTAKRLQAATAEARPGATARLLHSRLANPAGTGVTVARAPRRREERRQHFPCSSSAGEVAAAALAARPRSLGILVAGLDAANHGAAAPQPRAGDRAQRASACPSTGASPRPHRACGRCGCSASPARSTSPARSPRSRLPTWCAG